MVCATILLFDVLSCNLTVSLNSVNPDKMLEWFSIHRNGVIMGMSVGIRLHI